ncbi:LOW QUALITY PROTEIN: hypothetical protein CVT25_010759 [Psilocybe cyanescens]|uniref:Oxidoreductase molybdopterin-binding domain-containing protein n=1 Tax=Psilocybe cyanescens TaxID=93625 RepID=A0A409WJQ2_PSICY|nr:LOW QUALITY PROTEIN: hypothetical protein CVT25_010759 [Psilocybe cyanescens]
MDSQPQEIVQPPDEWKLEQGMAGAELRLLDDTKPEDIPGTEESNQESPFKDERKGWLGYIEWEKYPEKKELAAAILAKHVFPPPPEFQLGPIPDTNPVLEGVRWKLWHKAIGGDLWSVPEESWLRVIQEKHKDMLHLLQFPYNGEPPKRLVTAKSITPNSLHFVRNHGGIPNINASDFYLELDGLVNNPKKITLAELQNEELFPRVQKTVTIQCSGTRRIEQINEYAGEGDEMINAPWAEGAIGTAVWEGVSLKKVIKYCGGLSEGGKHLEFYGADSYFKQSIKFIIHNVDPDHHQGNLMNYVVSVPWSKVKANEVILAWSMNGEPLPKIHGFPLRAVVFGYIGARSCKWLYRIKAITEPSRAPVQSREYLYFNQQVGKHNQSYTRGIQIQEMPVSSAIMEPWNKQVVVHGGILRVKGWAYSGGGRWPERVEVSGDGGYIWYEVPQENLSKKHKFAWRTWHIDLPVDAEGWIELTVRCWDNSLNTQPSFVRSAWNWGLHVTSSCHRVKIYSINKSRPDTSARLKEFEDRGTSLTPITRPTEFRTQTDEDYEKYWQTHDPRDVDD